MYGEKRTKAFCSHCEAITQHEYVLFGNKHKSSAPLAKRNILNMLFSFLDPGFGTGDYQCTKCGTYLHTPDGLD